MVNREIRNIKSLNTVSEDNRGDDMCLEKLLRVVSKKITGVTTLIFSYIILFSFP